MDVPWRRKKQLLVLRKFVRFIARYLFLESFLALCFGAIKIHSNQVGLQHSRYGSQNDYNPNAFTLEEKDLAMESYASLCKAKNAASFKTTAKQFIKQQGHSNSPFIKQVIEILNRCPYVIMNTTNGTSEKINSQSKNEVSKVLINGKLKFIKAHSDERISQIEACAAKTHRLLVGKNHAAKVVKVYKIDEHGQSVVGTRSNGITGFMDYATFKKYVATQLKVTHPKVTEKEIAKEAFSQLEKAGLGSVIASLRIVQEDDLTVRNLGISTIVDNQGRTIAKHVVIFDVDRSFGSAVYGEGNKYGIDPRPLPGIQARVRLQLQRKK